MRILWWSGQFWANYSPVSPNEIIYIYMLKDFYFSTKWSFFHYLYHGVPPRCYEFLGNPWQLPPLPHSPHDRCTTIWHTIRVDITKTVISFSYLTVRVSSPKTYVTWRKTTHWEIMVVVDLPHSASIISPHREKKRKQTNIRKHTHVS